MVTIALPIHPLCGQRLPLIRVLRRSTGLSSVQLEHPDHSVVELSLAWTDLRPRASAPRVRGQVLHVGLGDLLRLATVVHSALSTPPFSGSSPERPLPIQGPRSSAARDGLPPSECSGDSPCALRDRDVPAPGSDPKGKVDGSTADTPRIPATPLGGDGRRRPGASPGPLGRSGARRCARIQRKQGGQR